MTLTQASCLITFKLDVVQALKLKAIMKVLCKFFLNWTFFLKNIAKWCVKNSMWNHYTLLLSECSSFICICTILFRVMCWLLGFIAIITVHIKSMRVFCDKWHKQTCRRQSGVCIESSKASSKHSQTWLHITFFF